MAGCCLICVCEQPVYYPAGNTMLIELLGSEQRYLLPQIFMWQLTLASVVANSMKPMPFSSPDSRSVGRRTVLTAPQSAKVAVSCSRTASSPRYLSKPFTKMVVPSLSENWSASNVSASDAEGRQDVIQDNTASVWYIWRTALEGDVVRLLNMGLCAALRDNNLVPYNTGQRFQLSQRHWDRCMSNMMNQGWQDDLQHWNVGEAAAKWSKSCVWNMHVLKPPDIQLRQNYLRGLLLPVLPLSLVLQDILLPSYWW